VTVRYLFSLFSKDNRFNWSSSECKDNPSCQTLDKLRKEKANGCEPTVIGLPIRVLVSPDIIETVLIL